MKLSAWRSFLEPSDRLIVPEGYPVIGKVKVNRPISDWKVVRDPLVNLLPKPPDYVKIHAPTVWGYDAYAKSFEKFDYSEPDPDIRRHYPREWNFACHAMIREYGFLKNTHIIDITATVKNVDSTPGFPKFLYWKTEEEYLDERGYSDYVRQYQDIRDGERPDVLWYLFLKKELLKKEKIEIGDIRQIVCPDPIFARIGAMFEQDQNNRMKSMTEHKQGQCGWSPFEGGFDRLLKRLEKTGHKYIELDWTRFDGTIPQQIFRHIKKFRFSMLSPEYHTEENRKIYDWYVDQICNRHVMLPSGEITTQCRGNPSGQISTTMDNNMVNTFLQAFEFAYVHPDLSEYGLDEVWSKCDSIVYGDDRVSSWPSVPPNYSDIVISMYKEVFGMWVKKEKIKIFDDIQHISFCGFSVIKDVGMYLPIPTDAWKFITSTLNPVSRLPDFDALVGKIISFQILTHNLPDDDPVKVWFLDAYAALNVHNRVSGGDPLPLLTRDMRDYLWRGGPKDNG